MYSSTIRGIINKDIHDNWTPFTIINSSTTAILNNRFINEETVPEITTIYFGKLIFLSKSPRLTIEFDPWLVASTKSSTILYPITNRRGNVEYFFQRQETYRIPHII